MGPGFIIPSINGYKSIYLTGSDTENLSQNIREYMDDLIDELPVEKRHLSKLITICRI